MIASFQSRVCLFLVAAGTAVSAAAPVDAQEPTRVGVEFHVADQSYRAAFRSGVADVESDLARVMADTLTRRIGFVRFVPGGQERYRLRFSLDWSDPRSPTAFVDRGIWVTLVHPQVDTSAYWFKVRDATVSMNPVGPREELVFDIGKALPQQDYGVIRNMLAHVPITEDALALPLANPVGWVLPLRRELLCVRDETQLRVVNTEMLAEGPADQWYDADVRDASLDPGPAHQRYRGGVFGRARGTVNPGVVKKVYVVDYRHQHNCRPTPAAPPVGGGA